MQFLHLTYTHTHTFNGPFSGTTQVSWYQKGKTSLDFTEARDGEWQWHQPCHMQVCTLLQTDSHTSTPPLCFYPSCRPTNSVKALKALDLTKYKTNNNQVGRFQKKHSPAHTHPGQRTSFITFLHLQWSTASSLFSLNA